MIDLFGDSELPPKKFRIFGLSDLRLQWPSIYGKLYFQVKEIIKKFTFNILVGPIRSFRYCYAMSD